MGKSGGLLQALPCRGPRRLVAGRVKPGPAAQWIRNLRVLRQIGWQEEMFGGHRAEQNSAAEQLPDRPDRQIVQCRLLMAPSFRILGAQPDTGMLLGFALIVKDLDRSPPTRLHAPNCSTPPDSRAFSARTIGCAHCVHQRPVGATFAVIAAMVRPQKHSEQIVT